MLVPSSRSRLQNAVRSVGSSRSRLQKAVRGVGSSESGFIDVEMPLWSAEDGLHRSNRRSTLICSVGIPAFGFTLGPGEKALGRLLAYFGHQGPINFLHQAIPSLFGLIEIGLGHGFLDFGLG